MSLLAGNLELAAGAVPFPCGQCLPCRINKRRVWTHRLILESFAYDACCFVTLTYDEEHISPNHSLVKEHAQKFIRSLRDRVRPTLLRYYLVGEYGEHTSRPHYHAIIFGLSADDGKIIGDSWPYGHVMVGTCTHDSIQYVAGYVVKKFIKKDDSLGRLKEFALMSRRPGIGYSALNDVAKLVRNKNFCKYIDLKGDVPDGLLHGKKFLPFGRYLKDKLRQSLEVEYNSEDYFRQIRDKFFLWSQSTDENDKFVDFLVSESTPQAERQKARYKIFNSRKKL